MHILQMLRDWITSLYRKIPIDIKNASEQALHITGKISEALQSNTALDIVALIPGDWDNKVRVEALAFINGLHDLLLQIHRSGAEYEIRKAAVHGVLNKMHSGLISIQDGAALPENRYDFYSQVAYSDRKS